MTWRARLIGAGLVAFVLSLLAGVPAGVVVGMLAPEDTRVSGIAGTLWTGSAAAVESGALRLGETRWSVSPLGLLLGRLSARIESDTGGGIVEGDVSLGFAGGLRCVGCRFDGPIADLRPIFPALAPIDGTAKIEFSILDIPNAWPTRVVGAASLTTVPAGASGNPVPGTFDISVNHDPVGDDGLIEAQIRDSGGPLELSGRLSLKPPGNFEFNGRAKPRAGAPSDIVNALAVLGPKDPDGATEIVMSGSL